MRIGFTIDYSGNPHEVARQIGDMEQAGLDVVWAAEAYGFDSVSILGYVAARTDRVGIGTAILNIFSRTPGALAQTAAGLDAVSEGRFELGIGASGPQVIEGWHGVPYDKPLTRTRELIDVVRRMLAREVIDYDGGVITLPLPDGEGVGLGKPLKMLTHPVRDRLPIHVASIGPQNVAMTAEIADGWMPIFFWPERVGDIWGESLDEGRAARDESLAPLDTIVSVAFGVAEGEHRRQLLDRLRPQYALYVGGMGSREKNFYNDLAVRYGFGEEATRIQDLYLSGEKDAAAAAVPDDLVEQTNLVGSEGFVKERLAAYRGAGVTTLNIQPMGDPVTLTDTLPGMDLIMPDDDVTLSGPGHSEAPTVAPTVSSTSALRTRGFPTIDDLPRSGRLSVAASAGFDVALRTAGASMVAGSMLPHALRRDEARREAAALDSYAALAEQPNRERIFVPPDGAPAVDHVSRRSALNPWLPGAVELLRFPSTYVTTSQAARASYPRHRNNIAWAQHWRHEDGPRPTVVVVHGFMASPYWVNKLFFSLPWWYANGYDLLLVTLPFHGRRARPWQYSGAGLFAGGTIRIIEGMLHAVHDIRSWINYLEATGVRKIGMTGVSLGGYLTSLLAAVDDRLRFAIPNSPVTDFVDLLDRWSPAGQVAERTMGMHAIDRRTFRSAMRIHSPLHHQVLLERERLFIITGLGDRLAPPEHARQLWHHWGRPAIHAFPGNHLLHIDRGAYLRRIGRFIRASGFAD